MLPDSFFNRPALELAPDLLGKVIRYRNNGVWLSARIIETEAYLLTDKGSHASLGYTKKRQALFADGGTIYMYYARGGDSVNFSAKGEGVAGFTDVAPGQYYSRAVEWAVKNDITQGVSDTCFAPNDPCTRAQVVTFMYRADGEGEVV